MEKIKTLNAMEKNLLEQAKMLIVDEYSEIKKISQEETKQIINNLLED